MARRANSQETIPLVLSEKLFQRSRTLCVLAWCTVTGWISVQLAGQLSLHISKRPTVGGVWSMVNYTACSKQRKGGGGEGGGQAYQLAG